MNRWLIALLTSLFPVLALAQDGSGSLSFAPPATDYSVIFLSNIFGVVDGVLHGSGSQIMGAMFGVFNAAVLALGGIVIMYTLIVSTMNTAHEGQMLGQKWSSIYIPIRSTIGLALLIPKASGYCLMQIFVMWLVVEGAGAADKVWQAALDYLNRGGVIIEAQTNPGTALTSMTVPGIYNGAMVMLSGQTCMYGLQKQLERQRQSYLQAKSQNSGPCSGTPSAAMKTFCDSTVPDFISSVNAVAYQNTNKGQSSYTLPMPNFEAVSPYSFLNGICGSITWNGHQTGQDANIDSKLGQISGVDSGTMDTIMMSRAIAVQQVYTDMSTLAQLIINNNPKMSTNPPDEQQTDFNPVAVQQFGIPLTSNGGVCSNNQSLTCVLWGPTSGAPGAPIFNGTEFLGAVSDYNGIMAPTLRMFKEAENSAQANKAREFIEDAENQGWAMAGSYFFDLVRLNNATTAIDVTADTNSGLDQSSFDARSLSAVFGGQGQACAGKYAQLCLWFNNDKSRVSDVVSLIDGSGFLSNPLPQPNLRSQFANKSIVDGQASSTVYGLINNSSMMTLPDQPGINPQFTFGNMIHVNIDTSEYTMTSQDFDCGRVKIIGFSFCLGELLGDIFFNHLFLYVYNFMMTLFNQFINQLILAFLMVPLQGMSQIFQQGLKVLGQPNVNPIVALANMGVMYINFSANLWIMLIEISITASLITVIGGGFLMALISLSFPLLFAWVGTMVTIGFTTAYYIPILPYMIFTFGVISWLMAVIEAMVAAPIVALGITHPEGHEAFGKGENALLILMNVFLRPAMMIIGYIAAIALSYVSVWIINAGFQHAISFMQPSGSVDTAGGSYGIEGHTPDIYNPFTGSHSDFGGTGTSVNYSEWAGIYAYFFSILIYTTMYLIVVQKAFGLIHILPDKVLRWIGGQQESYGSDVAQWGEEMKGKVDKAGEHGIQPAQGQIDKQLGAYGNKAVSTAKSAVTSALSQGTETVKAVGGEAASGPPEP